MENADLDAISLDNRSTAHTEASKWSDSEMPSLSIDGNGYENEFYLKEHYDKLERLRKENFDLKLKLYLLETDGNMSNNKEMKLKVIKEFDKKDEEVVKLQKMLDKREKECTELKRKLKRDHQLKTQHYEEFHQVTEDLRGKVSTAVGIFLKLIDSVEALIQTNRNSASADIDVDKLNNTLELLEKASKFIIDNSTFVSDHIPSREAEAEKIHKLKNYNNELMNISQIDAQEICSREFLSIVNQFRTLLADFRANKLTYRQFSDKVDPLFDSITAQHKIFENLYLDQLDAFRQVRDLNKVLLQKEFTKNRIQVDLSGCVDSLESLILKTKNATTSNL